MSALIFPGQGAQFVGMGKDLFESDDVARSLFERADALLGRSLTSVMFDGPADQLTQTHNSQPAIFVMSLAVWSVLRNRYPDLIPSAVAGLSLGEYTALVASERLSFEEGLALVQFRADAMQEACAATEGTMAAVLGLPAERVEEVVREVGGELWVANYNAPGQTVISGGIKDVEKGMEALKKSGARRVLPLQVSGAFHSGLMQQAQEKLAPKIEQATFQESAIPLVMNVPGKRVEDTSVIRENLILQVTSSVRWEQGIRSLEGVTGFLEVGPGKTLAGMNRQIKTAPTVSVGKIEEIERLDDAFKG